MLQVGKDEARRLIGGVTYAYKTEVEAATAPATVTRFADVHGTSAQRFYTALISNCSATSWRRGICQRNGPTAAKANTSRSPMRTKSCSARMLTVAVKKGVRQKLAAADGPIGPSH
jgi:hypothetical protein